MVNYQDEFVRITEIISLVCGNEMFGAHRDYGFLQQGQFTECDEMEEQASASDDPDMNGGGGNLYSFDVFDGPDAADGTGIYGQQDFFEGVTIASLVKKLHCTLRQMRSDIDALLREDIVSMSVNGQEVRHLNEKSAAYDQVPIRPGRRLPGNAGPALLFLDEPEYRLYRGKPDGIYVKDSPFSHTAGERDNIKVIEKAIKNKKRIRFRYHSPNEAANQTVTIFPRLVYHDLTNEQYYCLAVNGDNQVLAYRLDRILYNVKELERDDAAGELDETIERRLEAVWGADFSHDDEPVHVKVALSAGTRNVVKKFRADISGRKLATLNKAGTENGKDVYIYEDEIIGESAFRAWLRRYGSAVKVLEPQSMADAMKKNALRAKLNYESGRFLSDTEFERIAGERKQQRG